MEKVERDRTSREPRPTLESSITANAEKTPRYAWVIWLTTYLVSFAAPLGQFKLVSIPLYFIHVPNVSPAGGFMFDAGGFGILMTMVSIVGIILAFPAAFICRKLGLKWTITISALGVIFGGLIPVLAGTDTTAMFIGRFIEGLGIGLVGVAAPSLITIWFPDKTRGFALGLWCTWVPLSITLDSIVCPAIAPSFGWQGVFWFVIIFAAVALLLFLVSYRVPDNGRDDYNAEGSFSECLSLLKNRSIWFLGIVFIIFIAGQTGIVNTYLPNFLQTSPDATPPGFGWDESTAGLGLAAVTTIGLISNPLGGTITSRLPHKWKRIIPAIVAVIYLFCFYFLFQNQSVVMLWIGIVLMGICAGFGGGGLRPIAPAIMNQSAMAATMGMAVLQFAQCVGNCFSPIYGAFIDGGYTYWEACLYTIVPLSVLMLVLALFIRPDKDSKLRDK